MGEALAIHFVSKGWLVACVDLQRGPGETLAASLGPNAHFWEVNVADYDSQALMFQHVFDKWGRIDALLANAGIVDKSSIYILSHRNNDAYVGALAHIRGIAKVYQNSTCTKHGLYRCRLQRSCIRDPTRNSLHEEEPGSRWKNRRNCQRGRYLSPRVLPGVQRCKGSCHKFRPRRRSSVKACK